MTHARPEDQKLRLFYLIAPFSLVVVLDQFSKYWVRNNPTLQRLDIIEGVLEFSYTLNDGMAMGISLLPTKVISIIAIIATLLISVYMLRTWVKASLMYIACISLILGGAIGNIIDRIFMGKVLGHGGWLEGHVVDFIYFSLRIGDWTVFPYIFNVADVAISLSLILLLVFHRSAFEEMDENDQESSSETQELKIDDSSNTALKTDEKDSDSGHERAV